MVTVSWRGHGRSSYRDLDALRVSAGVVVGATHRAIDVRLVEPLADRVVHHVGLAADEHIEEPVTEFNLVAAVSYRQVFAGLCAILGRPRDGSGERVGSAASLRSTSSSRRRRLRGW